MVNSGMNVFKGRHFGGEIVLWAGGTLKTGHMGDGARISFGFPAGPAFRLNSGREVEGVGIRSPRWSGARPRLGESEPTPGERGIKVSVVGVDIRSNLKRMVSNLTFVEGGEVHEIRDARDLILARNFQDMNPGLPPL